MRQGQVRQETTAYSRDELVSEDSLEHFLEHESVLAALERRVDAIEEHVQELLRVHLHVGVGAIAFVVLERKAEAIGIAELLFALLQSKSIELSNEHIHRASHLKASHDVLDLVQEALFLVGLLVLNRHNVRTVKKG